MAYTTINKSGDYFNTVLYTGNASARSITGVGFQPDWCWFKSRGDTNGHMLYDAVRGATKVINSNSTNAEATETNGLTAFGSDGFSIGSAAGENANSQPIVAWNWKANGAASTNYDGSINSTVSANTTSGFSIVSYTGNSTTGATVGHGLNSVPKFIVTKNRTSSTYGWYCYHASLGATKSLYLHTSDAEVTSSTRWNDTTPTSSVFTLGNNEGVNGSTDMIAYCFAEKTGYSKFGSYVGNGNADGTFVYTGFKPAFVMTKKTSGSSSWDMHDTKRDTFNVATKHLLAEDNGAEGSTVVLDILSNGFKFRTLNGDRNASGATYIYMAFAEEPLVANSVSNGVPATAR